MADTKVILNGELTPQADAFVTVTSRGLLYGDGCFETLRAYLGRFLELKLHLDRLADGLHFLSIPYPDDLNEKRLMPHLQSLLAINKLDKGDAIVRIQVWREGGRGYKISKASRAAYSITTTFCPPPKKTYTLATVEVKRVPSIAVPANLKLSNGINYITAANQATSQDADDALLETIDGFISETTIANIFWMKGGNVCTPSINCDILPGVTSAICMSILHNELNIEVNEGRFKLNSIINADAVWVCNSVKEIQPVCRINETDFDANHPFIQKLKQAFEAYRHRQLI